MTAAAVVQVLRLLETNGLQAYVDGGWAVDALLEKQTRAHGDLDLALPHACVPQLRQLLERDGYRALARAGSWECNFVLADAAGHQVDIHSYTFDAAGKNIFGVPYPAESLTGAGVIAGYDVRCIAPEWLVTFHTGYEVDEDDYRDVTALCERFGLELPKVYEAFRARG